MSGINVTTHLGDDGYIVRLEFDDNTYHLHPTMAREIARRLDDAADLATARDIARLAKALLDAQP